MAIPQKIKKLANDIRTKIYGKDVRESLAKGIEESGEIADQSNSRSKDTERRQTNVEKQFDDVLSGWTNDSPVDNEETIAARTNRNTGKNHKTIGNRLDSENEKVASQLKESKKKTDVISNAESPLYIKTYEGYNQVVHPDVIYFPDRWNGYRYWMSYTPYPWTNDFYENPSIAVSDDGVRWETPEGLKNPLDEVTKEEYENGEHLSDSILVYRKDIDTLEIWYRWRNQETREERYYRRTTTDGINWTSKELVYQSNILMLSPSVVFENGKYRMWLVTSRDNYSIEYTETVTPSIISNWTEREIIPLTFAEGEREARVWHLHVFKENEDLYHATWNERNGSLYHSTSKDGLSFSESREILEPTYEEGRWDNKEIYRPTLTKVDNTYKLYYSARGSSPNRWYIGLTEGKSMNALRGSSNTTNDAYRIIPKSEGYQAYYDEIHSPYILVRSEDGEEVWLRLSELGRAGAGFKLGESTGWVRVVNDKGDELGSFEASTLKTTNLFGTGGESGLSLYDLVRILDDKGKTPRFKILHRGKYGVTLSIDDPDVLKLLGDDEDKTGHIEAGSIILNGKDFKQRDGALKYNETLGKIQGFSGTWINLNNYVSTPPASAVSGGNRGDYTTDDNYLYVCHRPGHWLRLENTW